MKLLYLVKSGIMLLFLAALQFSACGRASNVQDELISRTLGIDVSRAEKAYSYDEHGFFGDGYTFAVYRFFNSEFENGIKGDPEWHPMPLDKTVSILLYGSFAQDTAYEAFFCDENGNTLFPKVENGYWFFLDRHDAALSDESLEAVLNRASFNFTVAVYDADTKTLYYGDLDT